MLSKLFMLGGVGLLSGGFIIRRKQQYFKNFYTEIQKSKKYHLDFVDQLGKLPRDNNIILFGAPKSQQQTSQRILCTSIIKTQQQSIPMSPSTPTPSISTPQSSQPQPIKQFTLPQSDRLWKFSLKSSSFYLQTLSSQRIFIQQDTSQQLYAFNLLKRKSSPQYQQRVIVRSQPICVYGKLININNNSQNGKIIMKTKLIMGTKNQNFLNYLDKEIIGLRTKSKYFTIAGTVVIFGHFLYNQLKNINSDKTNTNNTQNNNVKTIDEKNQMTNNKDTIVIVQKSQAQNILKEMQKFQKQKK